MNNPSTAEHGVELLERRTIKPVPDSERHGTKLHIFAVWFGFNAAPLTIVTGLLGTTLYDLPLLVSFLALIVGNFAGSVLMALHSAQGTRLGVPQMIQSRGQFGSIGSILIYAVTFLLQLGFAASILVVGGQSAHAAVSSVPTNVWIGICSVLTLIIAVLGYEVLHRVNRWFLLFFIASVFMIVGGILSRPLPADLLSHGTLTGGGFLGTVALAAVYQITFAPFVSDYSRYIPAEKKSDGGYKLFTTSLSSYTGSSFGASVFMVLGALIGILLPSTSDASGIYAAVGGGALGIVLMVIFTIASIDDAALNLYSFGLVLLTLVATFATSFLGRISSSSRWIFTGAGTIIAFVLAAAFRDTFLVSYSDFLDLLFYLMIPWSIINLLDFFVLNHGHYDVGSFYQRDGGIYGRVRWPALLTYTVGVAIQIPFMDLTYYVSPVAKSLGGGDISWLVATVVVIPLYLLVSRYAPRPVPVIATTASAPMQEGTSL